ncbi:hypothetical protein ACHAQH_005553 [Verticillium albo-atrum]
MFAQTGLKLGKVVLNKQVPAQVKTLLQPRASESFICNSDFMKIKGCISIVNFYEQLNMPGLGELVVDKDSAVFDSERAENIPIARDHRRLVRFDGPEDDAYRTLFETLKRKIGTFLHDAKREESDKLLDHMSKDCIASLAVPLAWRRGKRPDEPHRATLQWFWDREGKFVNWLTHGMGFFSIEGKPGSGKTVLMGDALHKAKQYCEIDVLAHHFFNKRGQILEQSFQGFLQSVLEQILRQQPSLFQYMLEEWHMMQDPQQVTPHQWPEWLLKRALMQVVTQGSARLRYLMIFDALDECQSENDLADILGFLKTMIDGNTGKNLRILFSCRYLPDTSNMFTAGCLRMEQHNEMDISNLVNDVWSSSIPIDAPADEFRELKKAIIKKADGIFLWVRLALERVTKAIRDGGTSDEIRETIDELPGELTGIFEMLLGHAAQKHREETHAMLSVALTARKPLTTEEFRLVLNLCSDSQITSLADMNRSTKMVTNCQVMQRRIRSRCGGLLEVVAAPGLRAGKECEDPRQSGRHGIVQFVHQSVKDFLSVRSQDETSGLPSPKQFEKDGHARLAEGCLRYLSLRETYELSTPSFGATHNTDALSDPPLFRYAVKNWKWHCKRAEALGAPQRDVVLRAFGARPDAFKRWPNLHNSLYPDHFLHPDYDLALLAVRKNIVSLVEHLCETGELVHQARFGLDIGSYLSLAATKGSCEVMKVLLKYGADPNAPDELALSAACRAGNLDMLRMLLDAGAKFDTELSHTASNRWSRMPPSSQNSIALAAYSGDAEVVRLVLEHDPDALANPWNQHLALEQLLAGVVAFHSEQEDWESFTNTLRSRRSSIMSLLTTDSIDLGSIFGAKRGSGLMSMFCAAMGFSRESLDMWVQMNVTMTPGALTDLLGLIASVGPLSAMQQLVDLGGAGMVVGHLTEEDENLLHAAALNESPAIACYLLDLGTELNAQDSDGKTPLHDAARHGTKTQVELLLNHGADTSLTTTRGSTVLHMALRNPKLRPCKSLLARLFAADGSRHVADRDGVLPIHVAAAQGWLATVEWLIQIGAEISSRDDLGRTPLHAAAASMSLDSTAVVQFLVDRGLAVEDADEGGMTPLHHALYSYDPLHKEVYDPDVSLANARYLLQQGASADARDIEGTTPLHHAAWRGNVAIVKLLLEAGADVEAENRQGMKPVNLAKEEDVRELLEQAAEVNHRLA